MATRGHFIFPIDDKNHRVLVIWDLNGYSPAWAHGGTSPPERDNWRRNGCTTYNAGTIAVVFTAVVVNIVVNNVVSTFSLSSDLRVANSDINRMS